PAERRGRLAQRIANGMRNLRDEEVQLLQHRVTQQADAPITFWVQLLEGHVRDPESGVSDDGLEVVVGEAVLLGDSEISVGSKDALQMTRNETRIARLVRLSRPERVPRYLTQKLAEVQVNTRVRCGPGQKIRVKGWRCLAG